MPPPPSSHARHAEQPRKPPLELSDLEDAISTHRDAVHLSDGHPDKPSRLNNLGLSFRARFECLGEPSDLEDAISLYSHPASVSIGPISRASQNRILCARPDGRRSKTQAPSTSKQGQRILHGIGPGAQEDEEEIRTDEPANERSRNAAAAQEVSREMDVLMFN
ncbi:hypothetical protein EV363DRAFT_1589148 [Boletus edulis]|nr:hypothetical protein EV363DRAFT_1589148 [Boletus edulis]